MFGGGGAEKPSLLFISYTADLIEADQPAMELAVHNDIVPANPPFTRELAWKDTHPRNARVQGAGRGAGFGVEGC